MFMQTHPTNSNLMSGTPPKDDKHQDACSTQSEYLTPVRATGEWKIGIEERGQ